MSFFIEKLMFVLTAILNIDNHLNFVFPLNLP